jgi:hypothetical protein
MLSQRAQDYLAQLRRDDFLPVVEVERLIVAAGFAAVPAWLAFHEEFAGYREPIGAGDVAIWGLAFQEPGVAGGEPRTVYVNTDRDGAPVFIACADVHPSFDYNLLCDGAFVGPPFPSETFGVKVERNALLWGFSSSGPCRRVYKMNGVPITRLRDQLLEELTPHLVPEASDRFARYYASGDKVLLEAVEQDTLKLVVRPS